MRTILWPMVWSCKTYAFKNLDYIYDPFSRLFPKWTYNKFTIFSVSLRDQSSIEKKYLKKTKTFIPNILFFILSIYFNICTKVLVLLEVNEHSELMA